jgi:hypothetical protein
MTAIDKGVTVTETQYPTPDNETTLERHGIRGISGTNLVAQIAPLNARYTQLGSQLRNDETLRDRKWMCTDMQFNIVSELLGAEAKSFSQATAKMTAAYRRTYGAWLQSFVQRYDWYTQEAVQEQLANAWHDIEELLTDNPR